MMRLALDGTPLLGPRSGVGEVVSGILPELARRPELEVVAYALTLRGRNDLAAAVPPGVHAAARWFPARGVRQAWLRVEYPRVERWTGPVDVVHATNYVAPPTKAGEVVSVYDLGFIRYPEYVNADALDYPELLRRAVRRGAWFHTTSDFVRDEVIETFSVPAERVVRVYPGIPPIQGGDATRGRVLAGTDRYVLAIGTIEPRKNFPGLVRAFDALADDDPTLVLVVAGGRGWGGDAFDAALGGGSPRRSRPGARIRVGRGSPRSARRRVGARLPLALRGLRDPTARGDVRRRAGRGHPCGGRVRGGG